MKKAHSNKLLLDEYPLIVLPSLARAVGLNEAIVLQQIRYWQVTHGKPRDGRIWTYNSYKSWQKQFPWWSVSTIRRAIRNLEVRGILLSCNIYNRMKIDKTKWYSIDESEVEKLGVKLTRWNTHTEQYLAAKTHKAIPEINPRLSSETSKEFKSIGSLLQKRNPN